MKKPFIFLLIIGVFLILYYRANPLTSKLAVNDTVFTIEVAATEAQKQKGLGDRDSMPGNHGMLFPYDHKEQYEFWMRGMRFPLDFLWIDGTVIMDITENVLPPANSGQPTVVRPNVPVDRVLELNAGTVGRLGIKVGDRVRYIDR